MKGFTLIELLAVLVILAIILLIAVPIIFNIIEGVKQSAFESSSKGVMKSVENLFMYNSLSGTDEDIAITFTDNTPSNPSLELIGDAPKSGTIIMYKDGSIEFALHNGEYCATKNISSGNITVIKKDAADCVIELPEITLIGNSTIDLSYGDTFTDPGVNYITGEITTTIRKNSVIVPTVDTNSYGTYEITYKLTVGTKFNTIVRIVNILDTEAPVLTIPADTTIDMSEVATYDLMLGVSVTDNSGEIITPTATALPATGGAHTITYTATDSSGNTTTKTRIITVNVPPIVNTSTLTSAQMSSLFTGNPAGATAGTTTFINGGVIQTTTAGWNGAYVELNQTIPRTGELNIEYQMSVNTLYYINVSVGGALFLSNAATWDRNAPTSYNQPANSGVWFKTLSHANSNTFLFDVDARDGIYTSTYVENFPKQFTPPLAANTFYTFNIKFNLTTGAFEYKCNGSILSTGTMSQTGLSKMGNNIKIILTNGNYGAMQTTYKNIKVEVK